MRKFLFTGADRTGKSTNVLFLAKLLSTIGKKVIVIDTTFSQSITSFFNINTDLESTNILIRDNFEVMFFKQYQEFEFENLELVNLENYDYVFVEGDIISNIHFIKDVEKVLVFQDNDKSTLVKNKLILRELNVDAREVIFVFNNILRDSNFDTMFLLNELVSCIKVSNIENVNENIEIPFNEDDISAILDAKMDGKLKITNISNDYKKSLFNLVNIFEDISEKEYKRILGGKSLCN